MKLLDADIKLKNFGQDFLLTSDIANILELTKENASKTMSSAVSTGKTRKYHNKIGTFTIHHLEPDFNFGYEFVKIIDLK